MWLSDTLDNTSRYVPVGAATAEDMELADSRALERFLASVEKRAYRIALIGIRHEADALDIVQDAMMQLVRRYADRPADQWKPLFYRILQNRIQDFRRRRLVRSKVMSWFNLANDEGDESDPLDAVPDGAMTPGERVMTAQAMSVLEQALGELPARQREAFLLRNLEGMDVADTARAMGCSEGSVKTHYSRAVHALRERLGNVWGEEAAP